MNDVTYDIHLSRDNEMVFVRTERPSIYDKAKRRQWMKESAQSSRQECMTVPFTDLPELLQALVRFAAWNLPSEPIED